MSDPSTPSSSNPIEGFCAFSRNSLDGFAKVAQKPKIYMGKNPSALNQVKKKRKSISNGTGSNSSLRRSSRLRVSSNTVPSSPIVIEKSSNSMDVPIEKGTTCLENNGDDLHVSCTKLIQQKRKSSAKLGKFATRRVLFGKLYPSQFLNHVALSCLHDALDKQGWIKLFGERCPVYTQLVREFYKNLKVDTVDGHMHLLSNVNNTVITLSCEKLGTILEIPSVGFGEYSQVGRFTGDTFEYLTLVKKFSPDHKLEAPAAVDGSLFLPFHKLLHIVVIRSLIPRGQRKTEAKYMDLVLMELLSSFIPINLPQIMLLHMIHVKESSTHDLPYGVWLTKVFLACDVPLKSCLPHIVTAASEMRLSNLHMMFLAVENDKLVRLQDIRKKVCDSKSCDPSTDHVADDVSELLDKRLVSMVDNSILSAIQADSARHHQELMSKFDQLITLLSHSQS